jgi:hypothetical protein
VGHRMIQVGTGGFGATWCRQFLPPSVEEGRIEVGAAVDQHPTSLDNARRYLTMSHRIDQFVDWLDGGPPMATNVEDNLRSVVLSHAAIESGHTGRPVRVADVLARAHGQDLAPSARP